MIKKSNGSDLKSIASPVATNKKKPTVKKDILWKGTIQIEESVGETSPQRRGVIYEDSFVLYEIDSEKIIDGFMLHLWEVSVKPSLDNTLLNITMGEVRKTIKFIGDGGVPGPLMAKDFKKIYNNQRAARIMMKV